MGYVTSPKPKVALVRSRPVPFSFALLEAPDASNSYLTDPLVQKLVFIFSLEAFSFLISNAVSTYSSVRRRPFSILTLFSVFSHQNRLETISSSLLRKRMINTSASQTQTYLYHSVYVLSKKTYSKCSWKSNRSSKMIHVNINCPEEYLENQRQPYSSPVHLLWYVVKGKYNRMPMPKQDRSMIALFACCSQQA